MKKYKFIFLLFVLPAIYSCTDNVLDKQPLDIISDATVWNDESLIEAYLVQCYFEMYFFANESTGPDVFENDGWIPVFVVNEVSDEAMPQWRDFEDALAKWRYKHGKLTVAGGLMEYWGYGTIRKLNEFIKRVPDSPVDAEIATIRTAEARFLRAFAYFAMVKRYGGVPLITKVQETTDPDEELFPSRSKEEEVYDFILDEMDAIIPDLPTATLVELGRPSKSAALALKSRAALYAGSIAKFGQVQLEGIVGIPSSKANTYYQAAYDAADAIITSGLHALYNVDADKTENFKNIFLVEDHSEVIFAKRHDEVNYFAGGNGWNIDWFQCPRPQGWGRGLYDGAYLELAEAFEYIDGTPGALDRTAIQQGLWTIDEVWGNRDPRFYATFYTQETPWKGNTLDFHKGIRLPDGSIQIDGSVNDIAANGDQDVDGTCIGFMKYLNEDKDNLSGTQSAWPDSYQDWQIFRYAEILLNFAEAAYELGQTGEAMDAVNEVRDRAGIALLGTITQEDIRHERQVELAFEGHRYWDLRRWRTATVELSQWWSGIRYILDSETGKYQIKIVEKIDGTSNVPQFREENYYFPITPTRTGNNPNLVENPGY